MAGYLGSRPVVVQVDGYQREESESRYVNVSGDDFSGHLDFVDDAKARFGSSDELHIYTESSGSGHSYIQGDNIVIRSAAGTARLTVTSNDVDVSSGALKVGGTTVIDSSRVGNFNTGTVIGTYTTAPSGNPGQLAISRTGSAPYVSWHHEDGTRLGNIQFANASSTLYLSNEMSNGKWNFWNGTTTAAQIDHNGAAYFGGTTQASATRFIHTGGVKFSNGASTGGEFLSWDNEGATGDQSLIGYWYDGSSYRNRFRIAGDHGETVVNGSGDDVDFRVASDDNQDMFFLDASANKVSIGSSSFNYGTGLTIHDNTAGSAPTSLFLRNSGTSGGSGATIQSGYTSGYGAQIRFNGNPSSYRMASTTFATVTGDSTTQDNLQISTTGDTIVYNDLGVGHSGNPDWCLDVQKSVSGNWVAHVENTHNSNGYGLKVRAGDDGNVTSFRVSNYANTNTLLNVYGDGTVTKPNTPAFHGKRNSTLSNPAANTPHDLSFVTERFDQGNNFNGSLFTAPVTGKYYLAVNLRLEQLQTNATFYQVYITTSNEAYQITLDPNFSANLNFYGVAYSVLADMDGGDTAKIQWYQVGGSTGADINITSYFCGHLVA